MTEKLCVENDSRGRAVRVAKGAKGGRPCTGTGAAEEFAQTLDFIARVGFADMHVFPYSIRPGTKAAEMRHQAMFIADRRGSCARCVS